MGRSTTNKSRQGGGGVRRLLSSSGRLAIFGLLGSLATAAFIFVMMTAAKQQQDVSLPLRTLTLELSRSLTETVAHLRGWVAFKEPSAKIGRRAMWRDDIAPKLVRIEALAAKPDSGLAKVDIVLLRQHLKQLKYYQWYVEDVAHIPGNQPALAMMEQLVRPVWTDLFRHASHPGERSSPTSEVQRLNFRGALLVLHANLPRIIQEFSPAKRVTVLHNITTLRDTAVALFADGSRAPQRAGVERDVAALAEFAAVVVANAETPSQSQTVFSRDLKRVNSATYALLRRLNAQLAEVAADGAKSRHLWSYVVLAMALIVGALSAVSIVVSYRLEDRVERALSKAKSLGQYVLEAPLGGGGMGKVFKAKHALLRRPAAVKVLRAAGSGSESGRERFLKEVQLTSTLAHPNTIAVYDYGETPEGLFYYAMELVDGVSLAALVDVMGPLPAGRVVHILEQACGSLAEAHGMGLLHRDIKPSNIMLTELAGVADAVKVLDFGLAAQIPSGEALSADYRHVVGTPAYLAPEAIRSPNNASPRSDLYAVGAVGYYLLTGTRPFRAEGVEAQLRAHLHEPCELASDRLGAAIPEDLEAIIMGCLAKDPAERPTTAVALVELLEQAVVPTWTRADAVTWWALFGETARAQAAAQQQTSDGSSLAVGAIGRGTIG
ncbi:MAG: hypothetical protein ACI9MR_001713 [Myxococcota bacterium]|jgi:hypothetical protein